jgi:hypothetical protein
MPIKVNELFALRQLMVVKCRDGSFASFSIPSDHVGFSNRPVGVKRFQTIHLHGTGITRGLVLLSGIGT